MTRPILTRIRPSELQWEKLGTHGLRRKVLNHEPDTGYVTALVGIPEGWRGGGIAHYHDSFEEVFMWDGSVTVGGRHYWHAGDYFYRPARVVHGHDERSEEGALAVIRNDGPCELLLAHEPAEDDEYPLEEITDPRGLVLYCTPAEMTWEDAPGFPAGWRIKTLSADDTTGARTLAVQIPAGWTRNGADIPGRDTRWEAMVTQGSVTGQGITFERGDYTVGPAGIEAFDAESAPEGCEFILWQFPRGV